MTRPGGNQRRMRRGRRWSAGIAVMVLQGSCIAPAAQRPLPRPDVAQPPLARPDTAPNRLARPLQRPLPAPTPTPSPAPARMVQSGFTFEGPIIQGGALIGTAPSGTVSVSFNGVPVPITAEGRFLVAFDRDAPPSAIVMAALGNGQQVSITLPVARRAWAIETLNTLPRFAQSTEEFNRLRPAELDQINAARRVNASSTGWQQPFLWPVVGRLSGLFGSQRIYKNGEAGSYHSGADVAQPTGTPVIAPADGVVILAADHPFTLEGNLLMIDHGMGLNSAFLHLSRIDVKPGDVVRRGQLIGAVGMTGRATGPHLHWALKWRDSRIDPLLLAGPMPVVR